MTNAPLSQTIQDMHGYSVQRITDWQMFSYHNYSKYRNGLWTTHPDRIVTLLLTLSVDVVGLVARAGWLSCI